MTNKSKIKQINPVPQIVAGVLPSDSNIEFGGVKDTKKVLFIQNGKTKHFTDLPLEYFTLLKNAYKKYFKAQDFLSKVTSDFHRQVELYTYCMYGDIDTTPDIINGELQPPENFRDEENCPSLLWNKTITVSGVALTPREVLINDMIGKDLPDKAIAVALGISHSYFDALKRQLFHKVGVSTKTAYIIKAVSDKAIRTL